MCWIGISKGDAPEQYLTPRGELGWLKGDLNSSFWGVHSGYKKRYISLYYRCFSNGVGSWCLRQEHAVNVFFNLAVLNGVLMIFNDTILDMYRYVCCSCCINVWVWFTNLYGRHGTGTCPVRFTTLAEADSDHVNIVIRAVVWMHSCGALIHVTKHVHVRSCKRIISHKSMTSFIVQAHIIVS